MDEWLREGWLDGQKKRADKLISWWAGKAVDGWMNDFVMDDWMIRMKTKEKKVRSW